jgi:hypothetical protein
MSTSYHTTVTRILSLPWNKLTQQDLESLMVVSLETAQEFAESLRAALTIFPNDHLLKSMAAEELQTNNLQFDTWKKTGDHWEFLSHFLSNREKSLLVLAACERYRKTVRALTSSTRAMSIFSREEMLPRIFSQILTAPIWKAPLPLYLQAFRFYLIKHVELDSKDGGHRDMVSHLPITNEVEEFYQARLRLYQEAIPHVRLQ